MRYICGVKEIKTPITNKNITIMATNKIYKVKRLEVNSRLSDTVYSGRIRDCKKSLVNIEKAYKERGLITLNTGFALFIYMDTTPKIHWAYVIEETK